MGSLQKTFSQVLCNDAEDIYFVNLQNCGTRPHVTLHRRCSCRVEMGDLNG